MAVVPAKLAVRGVTLGPFQTNCYVVKTSDSPECWIIDASFEPQGLLDIVAQMDAKPSRLILTHAHVDHIAGIPEVRRAFAGLPIAIHRAEQAWLSDPMLNLSALGSVEVSVPGPDDLLDDGQELRLGSTSWRVLHTPGHSPGGITLYCAGAGVAIVGDTLFADSVGRTDFPGSDPATLERSIRGRLYTLPPETRVLPGHGPVTTIGREMAENPFVRA